MASLAGPEPSAAGATTKLPSGVWKSVADGNAYEAVRLPNGLAGLVVSDPETPHSAACMSVHIGHLHDPLSVPGCAHFLEHMLFLGTEAYPDEQEYKRYLRNHDGGCNASTGPEQTNYFFYVHPSGFEGALDRFAAFFTCPLLSSDSASREMKAVDSEFRRNLTSDPRRRYQLSKFLCREGHPYRRFGTGNLASLQPALAQTSGPSIEAVLRDFHTKYYDARSMRFVLLGREPLGALRAMAEARFGGVPMQLDHQPRPTIRRAGLPWTPTELGRLVVVEPLKDSRDLELAWPVPTRSWPDRSNPGWYVSHLLGHEGPGSLLASLKQAGWASRLSAGSSANQAFAQFKVSISLTPEGLANWEAVVGMAFAYVDLLAGPAGQPNAVDGWRWEEAAAMQAQRLRFKDKQSAQALVRGTARQLHYFPPESVLTEPALLGPVDEGGIRALLQCLHPRNVNITLSAKELCGPSAFAAVVEDVGPRVEATPDAAAGAADGHTIAEAAFKADPDCPLRQFEPWYGTRFEVFRFNARQLALWGDASPEEPLPQAAGPAAPCFAPERRPLRSEALARYKCAEWCLPPPNAYIAERFDLLSPQWSAAEQAARMQPEASAATLKHSGTLAEVVAARQPAPRLLPLPTGAEGLHLAWSARDVRFGKPKASLHADFHFDARHSLCVQPPRQRLRAFPEELAQRGVSLAADLALLAISEAELVPRFYDADLAGVSAWSHCSLGALHIEACGWTDKLGSMLADYSGALRGTLEAAAAGQCPPGVLAAYDRECERTERRFLDALRCSAASAAAKATGEVLSSGSMGVWERLELLRAAPPAQAGAATIAEALNTASLELLAQGNVGANHEVLATAQSLRTRLGAGQAAAAGLEEHLRECQARELRLPRASELPGQAAGVLVERMHCHPEDVNCAVSVTLQLGPASDRTVALGQQLAKLLGQPFFAQLRTKEQLGYSVRLSHRVARGASALQLNVQSASHSAHHALERILSFLADARKHLLEPEHTGAGTEGSASAGIGGPALRRMQESMADEAVQADRSRSHELRRINSELDRGRWRFHKLAGIADHLLSTGRDDLLRCFDDHVAVGGAETRLLAVLIHSQLRPPESEACPAAVDGESGAAFRSRRLAAAAPREAGDHRAALADAPLRQVGEWSLVQASGMSGVELQAAVDASSLSSGHEAAAGEWRGYWQNWREQRE